MPKERWTFESLCQANRATLEAVLCDSRPPNQESINGYGYDGYNHDWLGQIPGKKFRKVFYKRNGQPFGFNQIVIGDRQAYTGAWNVKMINGKPAERGYFSILAVKDDPPLRNSKPYRQLKYFNYNVPQNNGINIFLRPICDFVGLPNEDDHDLILGKAYLRLFPWLSIFASYFVLGHRKKLDYKPW